MTLQHTISPVLSLYRLRRLLRVYLLPVLVESNSRRRRAVSTTFTRSNTVQIWLTRVFISCFLHAVVATERERERERPTERFCHGWRRIRNIAAWGTSWEPRIHGRRKHQIYHLGVAFSLLFIRVWGPFSPPTSVRPEFEALEHTDCGRFDHVSDCESLYCLILWCASGAIGTSNRLDMPSALLVATAVPCMSANSQQLSACSVFGVRTLIFVFSPWLAIWRYSAVVSLRITAKVGYVKLLSVDVEWCIRSYINYSGLLAYRH